MPPMGPRHDGEDAEEYQREPSQAPAGHWRSAIVNIDEGFDAESYIDHSNAAYPGAMPVSSRSSTPSKLLCRFGGNFPRPAVHGGIMQIGRASCRERV